MSEHVDSAKAMEVIDLSDRSLVKNSLAATLVKDGDHMPVFNTAFEVFFSTRSWDAAAQFMDDVDTDEMQREGAAGASGPGQSRGEGGGASSSLSAQELAELLFRALRDADREALRLAAGESVTRYAGMEPGRPVGGPITSIERCATSTSRTSSGVSRRDPATTTSSPSDSLAKRPVRASRC